MVQLQVRLHSGLGVGTAAAFLAGEQVSGEVIARVDEPTKAGRICVEVFGHAFNRWREGGGEGGDTEFAAEMQFINLILLLWKPPAGDVGVLEPGNYCFPFSFVIPPNALPNHRSFYGYIDYGCKARVERRPWHRDDEFIFPFVVANIVDLNAIARAPNPVRICLEKELGCFSGSGLLSAEVSLDKYGYVGGEEMLIGIDIDNASSASVQTIQIRVTQEWIYQGFVRFWGHQGSRCFSGDIFFFNERVIIEPQGKRRYERRIKLPALQPSYGCRITVHNFYVQALISTDGMCSSSLCGQLQFYVGTVPLKSAQAVSPSDEPTVITNEYRNAAIRNVVRGQVVDDSCCRVS